ncbi:hypothetical protein THAOC_00866, partial [Thalassiosira oceanica]
LGLAPLLDPAPGRAHHGRPRGPHPAPATRPAGVRERRAPPLHAPLVVQRRALPRRARVHGQATRVAHVDELHAREHAHRSGRPEPATAQHHHERLGEAEVVRGGAHGRDVARPGPQRVQRGEPPGPPDGEDVHHGRRRLGEEQRRRPRREARRGAAGEDGQTL